jgi:ribosomal protein S18 acetylase RimI-like enzyme
MLYVVGGLGIAGAVLLLLWRLERARRSEAEERGRQLLVSLNNVRAIRLLERRLQFTVSEGLEAERASRLLALRRQLKQLKTGDLTL